jgi:hypothetical protein
MVTRSDNWPDLLAAYLKERKHMPFEWGVNDCMAFVAKGVEALTGEDFFALYNDYHDEESAKVMLENNGGPSGIIATCLGHNGTRNILTAKRGDVVIAKLPEITGGLVDDSGQNIVFVTQQGLGRLPLNRAWRVWSY